MEGKYRRQAVESCYAGTRLDAVNHMHGSSVLRGNLDATDSAYLRSTCTSLSTLSTSTVWIWASGQKISSDNGPA